MFQATVKNWRRLLAERLAPKLISTDETVEDASAFALEKHLEDFLVQNWVQTDLGKEYDIYEEDGRRSGSNIRPTPVQWTSWRSRRTRLNCWWSESRRARKRMVVGQTFRYMGMRRKNG